MKNIAEVLEGVKTVGIGGHIRPDGVCVGSCMALYLYIRKYFPDIDVNVFLDHPQSSLKKHLFWQHHQSVLSYSHHTQYDHQK